MRAERRPAKDPLAAATQRLEGCVAAVTRLRLEALEAGQKQALRDTIEGSVLRLMETSEKLAV